MPPEVFMYGSDKRFRSRSNTRLQAVATDTANRVFPPDKKKHNRPSPGIYSCAAVFSFLFQDCLKPVVLFSLMLGLLFSTGCGDKNPEKREADGIIVTSDTILSGMINELLPSGHFEISAILPPDQCPGHYDMKISDIQKVEEADLVISFQDLPFMEEARDDSKKWILLDRKERNWMAPDSYVFGLNVLARLLTERFPELGLQIEQRRGPAVSKVEDRADALRDEIRRAGIVDKPVLASSMQQETLEWMGLRVVGSYGRSESISVREVARLSGIDRKEKVLMVVDNLQSGPLAGQGIAEALGVPHVVLSNFPSEEGYMATLVSNVASVLAAVELK
jgi:zinc transport system substrate-binding protein